MRAKRYACRDKRSRRNKFDDIDEWSLDSSGRH
jgi:hypothetical protein